jgi:hypothetical protein
MKNNLAMTALLLDAKELKPHDLAREQYQKAPTNAAYNSTYAFSPHLQEKNAEALKVFQTLKPKELEDPSIAGYYGVVLNASGSKEKAPVLPRLGFQRDDAARRAKTFRAGEGRTVRRRSRTPRVEP